MASQSSSRRRVVITGRGLISALGDTPAAFGDALLAGESGVGPVQLFELNGLRRFKAGEVLGFDARKYLGGTNLRPLDRTARLVACAARLALDDSGWGGEDSKGRGGLGLVLGTMFGSVHTISAFDRRALEAGPNYAKPMDFANTVINAAAGQTAIQHHLEGLNSTLSGGTASGLLALAHAADYIRGGRSAALLAGGGDELCFESFYGFHRAGLMAGSQNGRGPHPVPFDARRNGFTPAEGAALLMLEESTAAAARGVRVLAEIQGHGLAYDPSRGRDQETACGAVRRAILSALQDADLKPAEIHAVSASANGSLAGDRSEAQGLHAVFGGRDGAGLPPVTAVKSMFGEALGASGALQTVALLEAMERRQLPGIRGLQATEEERGRAWACRDNRKLDIRRGLVTAVGLDGQVCALVLERGEGI